MKNSQMNQSPLRLTLLVVGLLGLILTSIFLNRRSVQQIQEASASIYQDRLVPTAIIARLTSDVYQKRLLLESYVLGKSDPKPADQAFVFDRFDRQNDSLMTVFGQTKLTPKEADLYNLLKQRLADYRRLEGEIIGNLTDLPKAQQVFFVGDGYRAFSQIAQTLAELSALQLTVGEELLSQSRGQSNYIYVLTALQIGLVLLIALSLFWHRF
ncbi:MCP four helix bundle domain-containing protein [Larkinella sp. VNQ87]|uniref:MCP four helix bundle domain-containing protein n=1 Tax=Larkinella sp. VNQ87 TaxID=3400921 RepID=UPI003BFDEEE1